MPNPSVSPLTAVEEAAADNATRAFPDPNAPHVTGPSAMQICLWRPGNWQGRPAQQFYCGNLTDALLQGLGEQITGCYSPAFADAWHDQHELRQWISDLAPDRRAKFDAEGWRVGTINCTARCYEFTAESLGG